MTAVPRRSEVEKAQAYLNGYANGYTEGSEAFLSVPKRSHVWRKNKFGSTQPERIMAKLTEEVGEVARALVGLIENREGRGDVIGEGAQVMIVVASLCHEIDPTRNVLEEMLTEMKRLGA